MFAISLDGEATQDLEGLGGGIGERLLQVATF
jgi:hypothetical protein